MKDLLKMSKTRKQIFRFIISGSIATLVDFIVYYILTNFLDISVSKCISYVFGIFTSYLLNKYFTFKKTEKSAKEVVKFVCLNIVSLCTNVAANKAAFLILPVLLAPLNEHYQILKLLAFVCANGASVIVNFMGQKFWVFKKKDINE